MYDPFHFNHASPGAFALTRSAGAQYVRLTVRWANIAPATRPVGFDATDPTSPGYTWSGIDATVEAAAAAGLAPILDITTTPNWAYSHRPSGVNAGAPKAAELGDFAHGPGHALRRRRTACRT